VVLLTQLIGNRQSAIGVRYAGTLSQLQSVYRWRFEIVAVAARESTGRSGSTENVELKLSLI